MEIANVWLVVWLGNDGASYVQTRHNAAWIVLGTLESQEPHLLWKNDKYLKALIAEYFVSNTVCIFVKPTTMMNNSGESVREAVKKYQVPPEQVIVIHDDVDIPVGQFSLALGKGDGNHNGVKSIIGVLGTRAFIRIRIGVAPIERERVERLHGFVLGNFTDTEIDSLEKTASSILAAIHCIVEYGLTRALNTYNKR